MRAPSALAWRMLIDKRQRKGQKRSSLVDSSFPDPKPFEIEGNRLYSVGQAAKLIGVHPQSIRNYISSMSIKGKKVGGWWRVEGQSIIGFLQQNAPRKTFLEYPPDQIKFPQSSFLMHQMITTMYDRKGILDACKRYGLLRPLPEELDRLWAAVRETAPVRFRKQLRQGAGHRLSVERQDVNEWVTRLGIRDLFGHQKWPCCIILEDRSEKRLQIEVMLVGRITHKEIVDFMATKYNFVFSEDQLDFFARHFFNTYNYNPSDRAVYLNRIEDRTEKYHKQKAWGDALAAKATLQIASRVNFEETLNLVAAMATLNFKDYAMGGPEEMPLCKDAAQMIFHSHRQLMALEKQRTESVAAATQQAQAQGVKTEAFEQKAEEPPSYNDLPQPGENGEEKPEAKAG